VVRGDLSLIGPRPLLVEYLDRYAPRQARRHEVLPGITGWPQVNGRNALTWEQKFEYDVWYVVQRVARRGYQHPPQDLDERRLPAGHHAGRQRVDAGLSRK